MRLRHCADWAQTTLLGSPTRRRPGLSLSSGTEIAEVNSSMATERWRWRVHRRSEVMEIEAAVGQVHGIYSPYVQFLSGVATPRLSRLQSYSFLPSGEEVETGPCCRGEGVGWVYTFQSKQKTLKGTFLQSFSNTLQSIASLGDRSSSNLLITAEAP